MSQSRRQELLEYAETGRLRDANSRLSEEAASLLVDIVLRYCEPRRPSRWARSRRNRKVTE